MLRQWWQMYQQVYLFDSGEKDDADISDESQIDDENKSSGE